MGLKYDTNNISKYHGNLTKEEYKELKEELKKNKDYWHEKYKNKEITMNSLSRKFKLNRSYIYYIFNPDKYKKHLDKVRKRKDGCLLLNNLLKTVFGNHENSIYFFNTLKNLSCMEHKYKAFKDSFNLENVVPSFLRSFRLHILENARTVEEVINSMYYDTTYIREGLPIVAKLISKKLKKPQYFIKRRVLSIKINKTLTINFKFTSKFIIFFFNVSDFEDRSLINFLGDKPIVYKIKPNEFAHKLNTILLFLKKIKTVKYFSYDYKVKRADLINIKTFYKQDFLRFKHLEEGNKILLFINYFDNNRKLIYDLNHQNLLINLGGGSFIIKKVIFEKDLFTDIKNFKRFPEF